MVSFKLVFQLLRSDTSRTTNLIQTRSPRKRLLQLIPLAQHNRILMNPSDETLQNTELHQFPLVDIQIDGIETHAQILDRRSPGHCRIYPEHVLETRVLPVRQRHVLQALLLKNGTIESPSRSPEVLRTCKPAS